MGFERAAMTGSSPRKAPPASGQRGARFWRGRPISAVTCTSCGTRSTTYRARVDDCLQELRWLYDRRDLPEARRDLAAWLAKWSGKYPKLTGWVEENIDETLTFYRLPRQRHSISRPGWRRTALSRRSLVRRAKGFGLSGSHPTRRWREMDSNFRFRASSDYAGVGVLRSTWAVLTLRRRDPDWNATKRRRGSERRASTAAE